MVAPFAAFMFGRFKQYVGLAVSLMLPSSTVHFWEACPLHLCRSIAAPFATFMLGRFKQ